MCDEDDRERVHRKVGQKVERQVTDPVAVTSSTETDTHEFYTGDGSMLGSVTFDRPASASLTVDREHRNISSATVPVHKVKDASLDYTYLSVQVSHDPEDNYPRVQACPHPDLPHRGSNEKFHPTSASTFVGSASNVNSYTSTSDDWPDLY